MEGPRWAVGIALIGQGWRHAVVSFLGVRSLLLFEAVGSGQDPDVERVMIPDVKPAFVPSIISGEQDTRRGVED